MKELKIQVERAVRPLRASGRRKDQMREELYAHLRTIHEEELAAGAQEGEALSRSLARFGESAALTRELQATIPRVEAMLFYPLPFLDRLEREGAWNIQREGESAAHWAARMSLFLVAAMMAFNSLLLCGLWLSGGSRPGMFLFSAVMAVLAAVVHFLFTFLAFGTGEEASAPGVRGLAAQWARRGTAGLAVGFAVLCSGYILAWVAKNHLEFAPENFRAVYILAVMAAASVPILTPAVERERKRKRDWLALDLDSVPLRTRDGTVSHTP